VFKFLSTLTSKQQKLVVLAVPTLTLLLSGGTVLPAWERYERAKRKLERQRAEMAELIRNLPKPDAARTYFVRNDAKESTMFVREITAIARGAECELASLSAPGSQEAKEASRSGSDSPWYVSPVTIQVSLVGTYPNIRRFLSGVVNSRRVYSVTGLDLRARWNADSGSLDNRVSAQVRLDRYVAMRARPSGKVTPSAGNEPLPGMK
jgi:hypothetical protein